MKNLFFLFGFLLISCSQTEIKENPEKNLFIKNLLAGERLYINTIPEKDFKAEIENLINNVDKVDFQIHNCASGQVACSDRSHPRTVFVNENFFKLVALEQFTSILHEAKHLQANNFEHIKCKKNPAWGYECDESINSPYGIEYKYLLHKYMHTKDEAIAQLLERLYKRINNI